MKGATRMSQTKQSIQALLEQKKQSTANQKHNSCQVVKWSKVKTETASEEKQGF